MSGLERGAPNIFPLVQETLRRFVPEVRDDDNLTIIVFDVTSRVVSAAIPKPVRGHSDREAVIQAINGLVARGPWTHTGAALTDALKEVYSRPDKNRPAAIILLTDGREDVRGVQNPIRIPDAVRAIRDQDVPYVFYVSLGTEPDPELKSFLAEINKRAPGHGLAFDDPGAVNLLDNARKIRKRIEELRIRPLQFKPDVLHLGRLRPGGSARMFSLEFLSPVPATLHLRLLGVPADHNIEGIPEALSCGPEQWKRVQFRVTAGDAADQGDHTFELRVEPSSPTRGLDPTPQIIPITVTVRETAPESLRRAILEAFRSSIAWIVRQWWKLLLLILLILLSSYCFWRWYIFGETPVDLVNNLLARRQPPPAAMLRTPDGEIRLHQSTTLGNGGNYLARSPTIVAIRRVGNDYFLKVEKGAVTVMDPSGLLKRSIQATEERMKLKHKTQILLPGYSSPVVYLNNSSAVRRY
jgi:hypothetical protein